MNELIEQIFSGFTVDNVEIPVSFVRYNGHAKTYITYNSTNADTSFYTDDDLTNYVEYYDFDIYSKSNYLNIIESVKNLLEQNGFRWQPTQASGDMYEEDTGYFHRTLVFAYIRTEGGNING